MNHKIDIHNTFVVMGNSIFNSQNDNCEDPFLYVYESQFIYREIHFRYLECEILIRIIVKN